MKNQTISNLSKEMLYPIMEHFYTLQGEGHFAGHAAYFIRLGGCNVGCVWCDVKESWESDSHPKMKVAEIIDAALQHQARIAVVTGGEPTMYNLVALTNQLQSKGFRTHLETAASSPITGNWDWVTLSPKKFKPPTKQNLLLANELKIIIFNNSDFKWAEDFAKQVQPSCRLLLQPEWSKKEQMLPIIVGYIAQHPQWQLSLQTHKYIHIP